MYHTSPPDGQAHLCNRQNIDDRRRNAPRTLNCLIFPVELGSPVSRGIGAVEHRCHGSFLECCKNLLEARHSQARFIGERQRRAYTLND